MKNNGLLIPIELVEKANFKSNDLTVIIEDGVIRIVEEDVEFCSGYFHVDDEEDKEVEEDVRRKTNVQLERQLLNKKGAIYLSVSLRDCLGFEVGSVLELVAYEENLVIRKLDL